MSFAFFPPFIWPDGKNIPLGETTVDLGRMLVGGPILLLIPRLELSVGGSTEIIVCPADCYLI